MEAETYSSEPTGYCVGGDAPRVNFEAINASSRLKTIQEAMARLTMEQLYWQERLDRANGIRQPHNSTRPSRGRIV